LLTTRIPKAVSAKDGGAAGEKFIVVALRDAFALSRGIQCESSVEREEGGGALRTDGTWETYLS